MAAPPLVHLSAMTHCFYRVLGFFCKLSQLWSSLVLSFQAVFSQPTAIPSLGPCSKLHFPAPIHSATGNTQFKLGCTGMWHRPHTQFLLCPAFHRPSPVFSFNFLKVPFCPSCFPHCEGVFLRAGTSSHLQLLPRVSGPFFDSFFLSFVLPCW